MLVGGSALYTRAVLDRFEFPGTDPTVRRRLEAELAAVGPAELHRRLAEADPAAAAQILPDNGRRIVRALEVVAITGRPFSATLPEQVYADPRSIQIGVDIDRPTLDPRIEQRVREMFDAGLVDEVRRLLAAGLAEGRTARTAIGYREVTAYLGGETTLEEAVEATTTATRRFSRRQDSWFRKDPRVVWVPWDAADRVEKARSRRRGLSHWRGELPVPQGPRHGERLRAAARPRRIGPRRPLGRAGPRPLRPARGASAPTASSASSGRCAGLRDRVGALRPSRDRGDPLTPSGSWTTATPTARSRRCAATASGSSPAT